jgi:hypothetical protein
VKGVLLCAALAAAAGLATPALAAKTIVYDAPATTPGNQVYPDGLGLDFKVNGPVKVVSLGAFDSGKNGITTGVRIGLFDLTTDSFVISPISFLGTPNPDGDAYVFKDVAPTLLTAGHEYSVVGFGFNRIDRNFSTNIARRNGNSPITFDSLGGRLTNGFSRFDGDQTPQNGGVWSFASAFGAGTLAVVAVPEPSTWTMLLLGFGGLGVVLRVRRRYAATPLESAGSA